MALTERATNSGFVAWWFVPIVVVVEVTLHELGHATVCEALGTPVREAGVALWCSVIPIAYVDCTDAYRLPRGPAGSPSHSPVPPLTSSPPGSPP